MSSPNSTSTGAPSVSPSAQPPTAEPSKSPAASPNRPVTGSPTTSPTSSPSSTPTGAPSVSPSAQPPTSSPMAATLSPSTSPQMAATQAPTLSPETSSLPIAPLNPNPDSFETNAFPTNPWFTSGDGEWSRTTDNAFNGTFSMKSPNFTGSDVPLFANATLLLGSNYRGGSCSFHYYASVSAPHDMLRVYVDGEVGKEILYADGTDPNVWKQSGIGLPPGEHEIVFSYQYNVFGLGDRLKEIPRPSLFEIEGTVWIDNVFIFEVSSKENG
ncbi:hypothetical protein THAOC_31119 [Thalassiosira oceanica]|uniref:MAM domain-containing protein n=1 Tax=Thalassiosira oceanica TaxID=159749 RepID=K0RTD4_THAOC|nr:hypothetical protein THAOC_31119 [Thalassiosira oceanica]|eukprot:EJK49952.1 hypothetical protein THAOC_31119 [Thalassiosira oceanica]